jgi:solute:Na+ symporter, SSS family
MAYPAMITFLPHGLLGLVVAGLLAAYVSTISTHLNWGTSYLVHDLYRRFLNPGADERHYVLAGRVVTAALMIAASLFTLVLESARGSFNLLLSVGAGTGLIYLLCWYWWRVNAWSEIAAMASSFALALGLFVAERRGMAVAAHVSLLATIGVTTAVWLAATWLTAPTDIETLHRFYALARPAGPGWATVRAATGLAPADALLPALGASVAGCALVYGALFGTGHALMGHTGAATASGAVTAVAGMVLARHLRRLWAS